MKLKYVIIVLIALLSFSSCNDWLDVVPQGQVQGEDLLTDEKGYNSALDGIYYKLTSETLYGMELSFGMMDVLAQYWDLSTKTKNPYYKQSLFDYEDATSKTRFKGNLVHDVPGDHAGQLYFGIFGREPGQDQVCQN